MEAALREAFGSNPKQVPAKTGVMRWGEGKKERTSKSEIIRQALRSYLGTEA